MKGIYLKLIICVLLISNNLYSQTCSWAKNAIGNSNDEGHSVCIDSIGNIYITGTFTSDSINFGSTTLYNNINNGTGDIFLVKYDSTGMVIWARGIGGSGDDMGLHICIDRRGNIYITGYFSSGTITIGNTTLVNNGNRDMLVARYDTLGNPIWAKSAGGIYSDQGLGICTDNTGNVYVSGLFASPSISFDTVTLVNNYTNLNSQQTDVFLVKYNENGNVKWAKRYGFSYYDEGSSVVCDNMDNVYLAGDFGSDSISFDSFTIYNYHAGYSDVFLAKLDSNGITQWVQHIGGVGDEIVPELSCDLTNNIFISGYFSAHSISIGIYNISNSGGQDMFLAKYSPTGTALWATSANKAAGSGSAFNAVDNLGNVYVSSCFYGSTVTFGSYLFTNFAGSNGSCDIYIVKYNNSGTVLWATQAGGANQDLGLAITTDLNGNIYITGVFNSNPANFDSRMINTSGYKDVFLAKYGICPLANQPGTISGSAVICNGTTNTYSISPVSGATSYSWTLPSGWSGSSSTTSITATASSSSGIISVTANNGCGSSIAQTLAITVDFIPSINGAIIGNATPCVGVSTTYSISAVAGATSYTWTLPNGWTGTSTTNSITTTPTTNSGTITVKASNLCGTSNIVSLAVTVVSAPIISGTINGPSQICSGMTYTYSILAVTGATSYQWIFPNGWTGASSTNSINGTPGASGNVRVKAINACGSSAYLVLAVTVNYPPTAPASISGPTQICEGSINTYSSTTVSGATSYTWNLPNFWTGNSTTNSIMATAGSSSGIITVTADNSCGSSGFRILSVTVEPSYSIPVSASICQGQTYTFPDGATSNAAIIYTSHFSTTLACDSSIVTTLTIYSVDTSVSAISTTLTSNANAATYQWINCINLNPISGATSQSYTAINNGSYAVIVSQNGCTDTSLCHLILSTGIANETSRSIIKLIPNPANNTITVHQATLMPNQIIMIFDVLGNTVYRQAINNTTESTIDVSKWSNGIYFYEVSSEKERVRGKIIVER